MAEVKSGINKVGNNYYQSLTREEPNGTVGTTLFRVNPDGSGGVPIYDVDRSQDSTELFKSFDPNATAEERRLLSDPNSQLSQVRAQQVRSSNPYTNPTPIQESALAEAAGGSGNEATTSEDQPSPDGGSSTPVTPPNEAPPANAKGHLIYPLQMRGDQDRIMFQAYEYQSGDRLKIGDSGAFGELGAVKYVNRKEPVFLSIQSSISDQNSVGWEPDTLNPLEIEAAELSKAAMNEGTPEDLVYTVTKKLGEAYKAAKEHGGPAIQTYLIGQAVGVNNLLSRLNGQVLNPNLELLFQGPQLRPFNFTFKMSARDAPEAKEIKDIIRYFKKNMAVKRDKFLFLKAPNVFKIQYQYGNGKPHKSLNLIKMCALTNCSVDYTPLGSYMTYDDPDKTMVAYTMSLQFQELTPIYDSDYEEFSYGEEKGKSIKVPLENSIGP